MARPKGSKNKSTTTRKKATPVLFTVNKPALERTVSITSVKLDGDRIVISGKYRGFGDDYAEMTKETSFTIDEDITNFKDY
jgi:hypothetical protein